MCVLKRNENLQRLEWHDGLPSKHNGSAGRLGAKLIFQNYFKDNGGLFVFSLNGGNPRKGWLSRRDFLPSPVAVCQGCCSPAFVT